MTNNDEGGPLLKTTRKKYTRGLEKKTQIKKIKDKKLKTKLKRYDKLTQDAAERAAKVELLFNEPSGYIEVEGMEKTWQVTQEKLLDHVDHNTQSNIFSLDLDHFGPYSIDYTRDGRHLLLGGSKGHIASFDFRTKKLHSEFNVNETVRDVKWLHNENMYAVSQKKYTYIYDKTGMELHCLRNHLEANFLEYLPYHWLLASVGNPGKLVYQDTSTGEVVSIIKTRQGNTTSMTQNKYNSILNMGHPNGVVTLWSPSVSTPLVKMFCHNGPVTSIEIDISGKYMATSGADKKLKLWDIRNYKLLNSYSLPRPATSMSISDSGILCVAGNSRIHLWKQIFTSNQMDPYMNHLVPGSKIKDVQFVKFEDVLGIGHEKGFSSIVVPGAGNPNYDSIEQNPFRTKKQRQESEVHTLLDKIPPDMIVLDPNTVAKLGPKGDKTSVEKISNQKDKSLDTEKKNITKKKSASFRRLLKKKSNIIDKKIMDIRRMKNEMYLKNKEKRNTDQDTVKSETLNALDRFKKKSKN